MTTKKLYIINTDNIKFIQDKMRNYTYAFHFLYKKFDESSDDGLTSYIMNRFNLNDIEYRSLQSDVKSFIDREIIIKKNKQERIEDLYVSLLTITNPHKRFKTYKKINKLESSLKTNSVFRR